MKKFKKIKLIDKKGSVVIIKDHITTKCRVDLSSLSPGLYIFEIFTEDKKYSVLIMKQKLE